MKKAITTIALIGALFIVLDCFNAADALMLFVFAGVIPGTDLRISPVDMMAAIATAITVVILRVALWSTIRTVFFAKPVKAPVRRTKRAARHTA